MKVKKRRVESRRMNREMRVNATSIDGGGQKKKKKRR
jgi:hypothetical protein